MPTYSVDSQLPSFYERECSATVTLPVYAGGSSPVVANSGTFTLYDITKAVVVTGAVTFVGGVATYTVPAASLPATAPLSGFYQEEWVLTFGTHVETFRRDAYLCLRLIHNVVTETMLVRRVSDLAAIRPPTITSYEPYIQEAWGICQRTLLQDGRRPYLAMNDYAFADWVCALTLELAMRDFATYTGEGRFSTEADKYRADVDKAFDRLKLEYDMSEQNVRSAAISGQSAQPVIYTNYSPASAYRMWGPRRV
jgi:hypothetical protein